MAEFVNVKDAHQFVLRSVKTRGLRQNAFKGKKTKGYQISFQVPEDRIKEIQEAWESHNPKNPTQFFGEKGNMLTVKTNKISDKMRKECLKSNDSTDTILADIRFGITDIYIDDSGNRFPQLKLSGLKKVGIDESDIPDDEF